MMKFEDFKNAVDNAAEMGIRTVKLTPTLGELFADKTVWDKLQYLEDSDIERYEFTTNFSLIRPENINRLYNLDKLYKIRISIYGHDVNSFQNITNRSEKQYQRFLENMKTLEEIDAPSRRNFELIFKWWIGDKSAWKETESELKHILKGFSDPYCEIDITTMAKNMGSNINEEDIETLDIDLAKEPDTSRVGMCRRLIVDPTIHPDGTVNACGCGAKSRELEIGNTKKDSIDHILSYDNPDYRSLIEGHIKGDYPEVCENCTHYDSVHKGIDGMTIEEVKQRLSS